MLIASLIDIGVALLVSECAPSRTMAHRMAPEWPPLAPLPGAHATRSDDLWWPL